MDGKSPGGGHSLCTKLREVPGQGKKRHFHAEGSISQLRIELVTVRILH